MRRRDSLKALGVGLITAAGLVACDKRTPPQIPLDRQRFHWKLLTTWPPNFPGFGTGAVRLAKAIEANTAGRILIKVYGDGELLPAMEVFDAVSRGTAQMGHGTPAYWRGKLPASQFFNGIPFGMTLPTFNAWLFYAGGWTLWKELYAPFNLMPFPAGNTGTQMGGWFRKEINTLEDLKGLKMRIAGFGGEVLARVGGTPVLTAGAEILTSLQTGNIDAAEFSGPYNDQAFGFHQVAKNYYYPGWHEPTGMVECLVNKESFELLPEDLQSILVTTCLAEYTKLTSEFFARNVTALQQLVEEHDVKVRPFPNSVMRGLQQASVDILTELADHEDQVKTILDAYMQYKQLAEPWDDISKM